MTGYSDEEYRLADEGDPQYGWPPCICGGEVVAVPKWLGFYRWQCKECGYHEAAPLWRKIGPLTLCVLTGRPRLRWRDGLWLSLSLDWASPDLQLELFDVPVLGLDLNHWGCYVRIKVLGQQVWLEREDDDV